MDINLNKVFQEKYDTYGAVAQMNNLINYMNNTAQRAGLVIFTTADKPRANGAANTNFRNAINNYAGCNPTTISQTPERGAYSCISMRNNLNEKQVLYQQTSSSETNDDVYVNYLNFYNFVNK